MSYTVRYQRDQTGWWVATVRNVRGCHTQGRTIEQARKRIREALGLFVNDADNADLIDDIKLPREARALVNSVHSIRKKSEEEAAKLQQQTANAARVLTGELGVSMRDAGELLGLTGQRIHQCLTVDNERKR